MRFGGPRVIGWLFVPGEDGAVVFCRGLGLGGREGGGGEERRENDKLHDKISTNVNRAGCFG